MLGTTAVLEGRGQPVIGGQTLEKPIDIDTTFSSVLDSNLFLPPPPPPPLFFFFFFFPPPPPGGGGGGVKEKEKEKRGG